MSSSRLLSILLRLQTDGHASAYALAATFEVSVRTIYRDMDALAGAGVPVVEIQVAARNSDPFESFLEATPLGEEWVARYKKLLDEL